MGPRSSHRWTSSYRPAAFEVGVSPVSPGVARALAGAALELRVDVAGEEDRAEQELFVFERVIWELHAEREFCDDLLEAPIGLLGRVDVARVAFLEGRYESLCVRLGMAAACHLPDRRTQRPARSSSLLPASAPTRTTVPGEDGRGGSGSTASPGASAPVLDGVGVRLV